RLPRPADDAGDADDGRHFGLWFVEDAQRLQDVSRSFAVPNQDVATRPVGVPAGVNLPNDRLPVLFARTERCDGKIFDVDLVCGLQMGDGRTERAGILQTFAAEAGHQQKPVTRCWRGLRLRRFGELEILGTVAPRTAVTILE